MSSRLYLGDCLEILPTLEAGSVNAVITDPPYPGLQGGLDWQRNGVGLSSRPSRTIGTPWGDNVDVLREFKRVAEQGAIVFCSWHSIGQMRDLLAGDAVGLVTWYKRNARPSLRNRPQYSCEHAWLVEYAPGMIWGKLKTHYDIPQLPAGCFATERILDGRRAAHPAQKPIELMMHLVQAVPPGATVLDPFMGTGTTGVACARLGRNFVGIEIDPTYFAIAERRIAEAEAQRPLPLNIPQQSEQMQMEAIANG